MRERERERDRKKSTPEYNIHENISFFPFSLSLSFFLFFFSLVKRKILSISRFLATSFFLCFLNIQLSNNNQERNFLSLVRFIDFKIEKRQIKRKRERKKRNILIFLSSNTSNSIKISTFHSRKKEKKRENVRFLLIKKLKNIYKP